MQQLEMTYSDSYLKLLQSKYREQVYIYQFYFPGQKEVFNAAFGQIEFEGEIGASVIFIVKPKKINDAKN